MLFWYTVPCHAAYMYMKLFFINSYNMVLYHTIICYTNILIYSFTIVYYTILGMEDYCVVEVYYILCLTIKYKPRVFIA